MMIIRTETTVPRTFILMTINLPKKKTNKHDDIDNDDHRSTNNYRFPWQKKSFSNVEQVWDNLNLFV